MIGPDEQLRVETRSLIVRIITSGASRERMTEMLRLVHKDEAWPVIWAELEGLEGGEGEL
ncbi:MAG: hypothetical protein M3R38_07325 [Actinomycetota bacterium]|nr:hypothetical protein [Actinomycetota bacterium]